MTTVNNMTFSLRIGLSTLKRGCTGAPFHALNHAFHQQLDDEEKALEPFMGGISQYGYQCGQIWGAVLSAGARAYQHLGPGPQAETRAIIAAQKLVESFDSLNNNINCMEITDTNKSSSIAKMIYVFLIKGGSLCCMRRVAKYTPVALNILKSVISNESIKTLSPPVSCTAILAQKIGVSDMHTVMLSGFAGGIGLCGGACGALGAALWIKGKNNLKETGESLRFRDPRITEMIDEFLKCTDYQFECSEIVGRKFKNGHDHACFIHDGGCSEIIETLAEIIM